MRRIVTYSRSLAADQRGTMLVGYSSLMLLIAIAAIAMLTQIRGGENTPLGTMTNLSN